jgi:hypothetical protein
MQIEPMTDWAEFIRLLAHPVIVAEIPSAANGEKADEDQGRKASQP